jgi:hypothetical protein
VSGQDSEYLETNAAHCPFCGVDAVDAESEPCEHLVADWSLDPYDNGGGVLGEGHTANRALVPAVELGRAFRDLLDVIDGTEAVGMEAIRAAIKRESDGDYPRWWEEVESIIEEYVGELFGDAPEELAVFANPVVDELIADVAGIKVTGAILGGMTSGFSTFIWSQDNGAATEEISKRIVATTSTVRAVITAASRPSA